MQPLAPSYVSHLDFLRFVRRLHATIGPAVLNATFFYWKMSRIRRRFQGTIGPAVLKSTFFVPPAPPAEAPPAEAPPTAAPPTAAPPEGFQGSGGGPEPGVATVVRMPRSEVS